MQAVSRVITIAMLGALFGCTPSTSISPPPNWVRIDGGRFSFYVPPDVTPEPVQGIDSVVGAYNGNSIWLGTDYGRYSDSLETAEGGSGYIAHQERIDGMKARVASFYFPEAGHPFKYAIGVYFPSVSWWDHTRLTVFARCKTTNDYETAQMIFRTIKFN
jgi:hypothetical protein